LRFKYEGRSAAVTERSVEPHRLVHTGLRWYLVAWDVGRRDWRTFRVDRIQPPLTTSSMFVPRKPPEGDFAAYVSKSVSYRHFEHRARVTLYAPVAKLAERIPPMYGSLEAIDETSCTLITGAPTLEMLAIHLAFLGVDFKIHEPNGLEEHLKIVVERVNRSIATA
jgi:predicted DNA-binding transcriptional regulator YafY